MRRIGIVGEGNIGGTVVVLAPPGAAVDGVVEQLRDRLDGKVVVDATKPYGDDPEARATVASLIADAGFAPVELGAMSEVWRQEPDGPLHNNPMTEEQARQALLDG